jgi:hypothetical protein
MCNLIVLAFAGRFKADRFNLLRNRASALVGAKKKAKEADGETDVVRLGRGSCVLLGCFFVGSSVLLAQCVRRRWTRRCLRRSCGRP